MAAQKFQLYNNSILHISQGDESSPLLNINLETDTIKIALFQGASNCATLTHDQYGDLDNEVANGSGYTTGGVTLTSTAWNVVSTNICEFDSDAASWTASGGSIVARFAVMYSDTPASKPLIGVFLLDASSSPGDVTTTTGNDLTITPSANGWFRISINNA